MFERPQLVGSGERRQRLALPCRRIAVDVANAPRRQDEEAAVNPRAISIRLLYKAAHRGAAVQLQRTVAARRLHSGHGGQLSVLFVEGNLPGDIEIRNAISVREA